MSFYSGWGGRVMLRNGSTLLDSMALPAGHWSMSIKSDPIDATTFEHLGFQDVISSVTEIDITVDCYKSSDINEFAVGNTPQAPTSGSGAATANLIPGGTLNSSNGSPQYIALRLDLEKGTITKSFNFDRVKVTNCMVDTDIRGIVKYTFSCKATRSVIFGTSSPTTGGYTGIFPTTS